ncbi:nucleolin-like isoform X1 [Maniola hyperantus]|uniref:nucleolin-like isoform X1 n=1 Tax=Aphantopus hyperantus TaxID=2795564 RepID=UPI003747C709
MDYVVGSIAALLTGNVTPNRPKPLRNAQTPMKNQPSPNVTPKSEFVEDRSIFLSPTMQKKKAMVKKSPKRIFQNSDPDINGEDNDSSLLSPKADKVKKHLKNDLEADSLAPTILLSPKSPKNNEISPKKRNKKRSSDNIIVTEENTQKKKKRVSEIESEDNIIRNGEKEIPNAETTDNSPKKKIKRRKSVIEINDESSLGNSISKKKNIKSTNEFTVEEFNISTEETKTNTSVIENQSPKKDKKKKKSQENGNPEISKGTKEGEMQSENKEMNTNADATESLGVIKKKKNRKKKKPKQVEVTNSANSSTATNIQGDSIAEKKSEITEDPIKKKKNRRKKKSKEHTKEQTESLNNSVTNMEVDSTINTSEDIPKKKKKKSKLVKNNEDSGANEPVEVNPNAVTSQDTDSEHDSDDEIDSENEEDNKKVLDTGPADDSSDEEPEKEKIKNKEGEQKIDQLIADEELKRTLFVGNVPFSGKTKKEMKKIFSKYGQIETVRIRTVPIKDARDTPKLAIIKKELHPDRTTVHVYIRFSTTLAVQKALAENNTVLNGCHLRVQPSESTGVPHDPKCSIFVGNMPFTLEDEALRSKFEKCGEIESVRIVRDRATCIGKGPTDDSSDEAPEEVRICKEELKIGELTAEEELKRTLFVGNVPFSGNTKEEMKRIFSKYGEIEAVKIRTDTAEQHRDRTTVHVYIRFSAALAVQKALVENNTVLNGCHLRVQPSETSGVPHDPKCSIFVCNIPFTLEDEALRVKFEKCGELESVRILRNRNTCSGSGNGFVNFKSKDGVKLALAMTEEDLTIENQILRVRLCTASTEKKQPRKHYDQGMESTGGKFGRGTQNDSGKKRNFRRQDQGNEAGRFGKGKFGGRKNEFGKQNRGNESGNFSRGKFGDRQNDFGKKENFRRQDQGNEAGSFNRGKFDDRQNEFGKKENFRRKDQGNEAGSFSSGKFGDRQNDFRKKENFRRQDQGNEAGSFSRGKFGDRQNMKQNFRRQDQGNKVGNFSRGKFDGQGTDKNSGAYRRVMNKRKNEDSGEGPSNKRHNMDQPPREKKEKKEFVGMTAEK